MLAGDPLNLINKDIYSGIESRVLKLEHTIDGCPPIILQGNFYYLPFKNRQPTIDEFISVLYDKITYYCIPRTVILSAIEEFTRTKDVRHINKLHEQARNLFIRNYEENTVKRHGAHLGEPGELILFLLMEAFFDAPQIACKMYLKTSENMPVHGSDGIHIKYNADSDELLLFWGESKLYSKISSAFDEIVSSICKFISERDARNPRNRDIDIIKDHPNIDNEKSKDALLKFFNPYEEESNRIREIYSCFVGFDYNLYNHLADKTGVELREYFLEQYLKRAKTAVELFCSKVKENNIEKLDFHLLLLPFPSVEELRNKFFARLGYPLQKEDTQHD